MHRQWGQLFQCLSRMTIVSLWFALKWFLFLELCAWVLSCMAVSGSLRPYGLSPAGILSPWDSPDKNTGVGCHFLLQEIFPTKGSKLGFLHCRQALYHLSYLWVCVKLWLNERMGWWELEVYIMGSLYKSWTSFM